MHRHWLTPDWDPGLTLAQLPLEPLLGRGIRVLLLDVDRTLLPGRDVQLPAPMQRWTEEASRLLHIHLISNNTSRRRIQAVADQLNVTYTSSASKPRRGAIRRVISSLPNSPAEIAMVGDRRWERWIRRACRPLKCPLRSFEDFEEALNWILQESKSNP